MSMRELALHLGIGAGSLYHHFESKEQLLFELIEELYDDLLDAAQLTDQGAVHGRLLALLQAHITLHERRGLHFLMAEREYRCLSPRHQSQIQQMRRRYEEKLLVRLLEAGASGPLPVLKATVQGAVAWLNNLPAWLDQSGLSRAQRQEVIGAIVVGSLAGVLKQPSAAADGATVVPLRVPKASLHG
ncbi:TetR/AcrR family transcriptional regulator [Pseudomonas lalucatii]|nr:TetR/AcrR family transcriptional regulator [Pseudomonas lalucatii]